MYFLRFGHIQIPWTLGHTRDRGTFINSFIRPATLILSNITTIVLQIGLLPRTKEPPRNWTNRCGGIKKNGHNCCHNLRQSTRGPCTRSLRKEIRRLSSLYTIFMVYSCASDSLRKELSDTHTLYVTARGQIRCPPPSTLTATSSASPNSIWPHGSATLPSGSGLSSLMYCESPSPLKESGIIK